MDSSWVAVVGTGIGAVLGTAGSLFTTYLQRRWGQKDREAELERAAKEAMRLSRIESDAATFRALKPALDALQREWNRLGGGPGPNDGAIGEPGQEFKEAAANFEAVYWQAVLLDAESQRMMAEVLQCLRGFAIETMSWLMWRDIGRWPGMPSSDVASEMTEHQNARKRLTGEFRDLYASLNRRMAEYVGMHRIQQ